MTLYFANSEGNRRIIGYPDSEVDAMRMIQDFLRKNDYKSYYTRKTTLPDGEIQYDVGSWSEFFYLDPKGHEK